MNEIFVRPANIMKKCLQLQRGYATLNVIFGITYYLELWNTIPNIVYLIFYQQFLS